MQIARLQSRWEGDEAKRLLGECGWPQPAPMPRPRELPLLNELDELTHEAALPPGAVARFGRLRLNHGNLLFSVTFSPDGTLIASCGSDKVRLWDAASGRLIAEKSLDSASAPIILSSGDVIVHCQTGIVRWSRQDDSVATLIARKDRESISSIAVSPDEALLAIGKDGPRLSIHSLEDGELKYLMPRTLLAPDNVYSGASRIFFMDDNRTLAVHIHHKVMMIDAEAGQVTATSGGEIKNIAKAGKDIAAIVSDSRSNQLVLLDRKLREIKSRDIPRSFNYLRTGNADRLLLTSNQETRLLDVATLEPVGPTLPPIRMWLSALSADGTRLAWGEGSAIRLIDTMSGKELIEPPLFTQVRLFRHIGQK